MQLISKFTKGFRFLITITNAFQKFFDESNCKPNKIWVDKGSEFYKRSMKSFLQNNDRKEINNKENLVKKLIIKINYK